MSRYSLWTLLSVFFLCHYAVPESWYVKELGGRYSYTEELTVTGKNLKICKNHRNMCAMDTKDCASKLSHGQARFVNTSCRYHVLQRSFACKWIYLNNVKAKTTNSFLFSQRQNFKHCPSIFTPLASFNINIISKDIISKVEFISEAYTVSMTAITQAPRPLITSVNATATALNVTWNKRHWHSSKCKIRYRCSITEQQAVDLLAVTSKNELKVSYVIEGLQPFSLYNLTVACSGDYGLWSEWSEEFQGMTLEAIPTEAPYVSFYVEPSGNRSTPQKLIVIWRALKISVARGIILGYEVTYMATDQTGIKRSIHMKKQKATLEVSAEEYDVTVMAYNSAGRSPSTHLRVSIGLFQSLPRVKGLWASSEASSLRIRWETAALNVTEFAIEWFSFGDVASQWERLNASTFSVALKGTIKPLKVYNISVYALYGTLCAPPETIRASLECGTLLDIVQLQTVNVTKASAAVQWVWKERSSTVNVLQYRLVLSGAHENKSSLVVFPHQRHHSFYDLQTNVKYTVSIYAETTYGHFIKANVEFTTPYFETNEIIKAAAPILLIIFALIIFSVLSRTVYKDQFFPQIANPGLSLIGHWLLNPSREMEAVMNVLNLEDFSLPSHPTEKSLIHIEPKPSLDRQSIDDDMTMLKMSLPDNDPVGNSESINNSMTLPGFSEYVDLPLRHANFGYVENCDIQQW